MYRRAMLASLLAAAALPATGQTRTVTLAVTDVEGLEALQREWGPFVTAFEKASAGNRSGSGMPPAKEMMSGCSVSLSSSRMVELLIHFVRWA